MCIRISNGDYEAVLETFGGGIKSLTYQGKRLLETYTGRPPLSANIVLAPWPNRLEDGSFTWHGETFQLPINEPDRNNALHGCVDHEWNVIQHTDTEAVLEHELSDPWPFRATITATYTLAQDGLHANYRVDHDGPFAFGLHTYLSAQGAPADACVLEVAVDEHHELSGDRLLPTGNITQPAPLPWVVRDCQLDDLFHANGARSRLIGPDGAVELYADLPWLQIYTAPEFPGLAPGQRAIAVEPMSAPPNALASGVDLSQPGTDLYTIRIAASAAKLASDGSITESE